MKPYRDVVSRLEKLEAAHGDSAARFPYVIRVSEPPTESELAQIKANAIAGVPFARMPHKAGSMAEWLARYASLREGAREEAMAEFKRAWQGE
jgi:hypothetical protein